MVERHRKPVVKGNYAVYLGKYRTFPNDMSLIHGGIHEIAIYPPEPGYTFYQVRVKGKSIDMYLPYACVGDIWNDWMPYGGEYRRCDGGYVR